MADVSSALPSATAPYSALTFAQLGNGPANSSPGVGCGLSDARKNATERTNRTMPALLINPKPVGAVYDRAFSVSGVDHAYNSGSPRTPSLASISRSESTV